MRCARAVRMSGRGESGGGDGALGAWRVRWRYVKGGLRIVIFFCAGRGLDAGCDGAAAGGTDAISLAWMVNSQLGT